MGLEVTITNAAHKYGLDDMAVTPSLSAAGDALRGTVLTNTASWGSAGLAVGQRGVVTTTYSGGFTAAIGIVNLDNTYSAVTDVKVSRTDTAEVMLSATGSIKFSAATSGTALQEQNLYSGDDHIVGNAYNNTLGGYGGNDRIEGGGGIDTVVLLGLSIQYQLTVSGTAMITQGPYGTDTLVNISRLQFDDKSIAYDTSGNAGMAYRIYQAAFNRTPDSSGLGFWISAMDKGTSLTNVASGFMSSAEFVSAYGSHPTSSAMVTRFYQNVLHRAPDQGGLDFWTGALDSHATTAAAVLASFSESPENQAQIIGSIQHGISYTPYG